MKQLKILNLSTTSDGGAGLAAKEFNRFLRACGFNSKLVVKESYKNVDSEIIVLEDFSRLDKLNFLSKKILNKSRLLYNNYIIGPIDSNYSFFNISENKTSYSAETILQSIQFKPDIIFIHWVTWFINSRTIFDLWEKTNAKIFWIMMDNAPLTGGCHYSWDCINYTSECQNCPAIKKESRKSISERNLQLKRQNLPTDIEIIACSQTDYLKAIKSSLFVNKKIHKLILPVDEKLFNISEKRVEQRTLFNLPSDKKTILFASISIVEKRKGFVFLISALHKLKGFLNSQQENNVHLAILGQNFIDDNFEIPFEYTLLGHFPFNKLPQVFQAADVFVSPSIQDSGPLMINQALMCGTPVVSFKLGVATDLVIDGFTGYQAEIGDSEGLALGIYNILNKDEVSSTSIRKNCRQFALKNFSFNASKDKLNSIINEISDQAADMGL